MKKFLFFIIFSLGFLNVYAQLDREHWFAPMVDRSRTQTNPAYQTLYMSTDQTTPFPVTIYSNNVVIGTVTISKNNPGKFDVPRQYIISNGINTNTTLNNLDVFKVITKGLYLNGERPFFASLRFSVYNHGEIITSKGGAGLGTTFRAVPAPITAYSGNVSFMTSVLATEDNTQVTINGFNPSIIFTDGAARTQFTFTLNRGQSYIIDGMDVATQNMTGFIGAKIVANKPITITNGNFNGQYATTATGSTDILMDQGVPVEKLGQEFVLMKGNGPTTSNMEKALIVATEDNTQIYLNGSATAVTTLNAGQSYTTPNNAYIQQTPTAAGHYNMHIRADKNIYVYQLLAGLASGSVEATGGMNYIPPLSCYLPKKIDEIGKIQENFIRSNNNPGGILNVPTKLNIITEKGATIDVKRDGVSLTLNANNGPFNVTGTNDWVTYSIPNITGNVAVFSSHAVTAGISAGNDAVGYGGYFAGFSFTPAILKSQGECIQDGEVRLEVIEGFNSYQWVIKTGATYVPAPGVNNLYYYIPTQAGIYAVILQQGSCDPIQTDDFKFFNCTSYTNTDYDICSDITITPAFSLSTQSLNPPTVVIDTPPTKGTATVNTTTGVITYTATPNQTGIDTFKYTFDGIGAIPDRETAQATIHLNQIEKYDVTLQECTDTTTGTYDLTLAAVTPDTSVTKVYYQTLLGAQNQIPGDVIPNPTNYTSAGGFVYVRMQNNFGCFAIAQIELQLKTNPGVHPELYTKLHCDEDIDGIIDGVYKVDLNTITPIVVPSILDFTRYYTNQASAIAGGTDNITGIYSFNAGSNSIWVRADNPQFCNTIKEIILNIGNKVPLIADPATATVCDSYLDSTEDIDLTDYINVLYTGATTNVWFYNTLADAQNNTPAGGINTAQTITGDITFYVRIIAPGFCDNIGTLNLLLKDEGTPSPVLLPTYTTCEDKTIVLDPGPGYASYLWNTGAATQTIT
ncbi:MAG: gliding motility protein, partial [Flavobacteriaceae bacterium]|nr:gliding motility protein [Flavobacteriaceae bacterium]